jgi:hypothetical protein
MCMVWGACNPGIDVIVCIPLISARRSVKRVAIIS